MRFKPLLITVLLSACAAMPFPGFGGGQAKKTETSSSSTTEEMNVNGRPVSVAQRDEDEPDEPKPHKKSRKSKDDDKADIGKTCHKNHECDADACFVGNGDLGYCTKMCNSWSDCPSHWECKRANNAPQ